MTTYNQFYSQPQKERFDITYLSKEKKDLNVIPPAGTREKQTSKQGLRATSVLIGEKYRNGLIIFNNKNQFYKKKFIKLITNKK